MISLSRFISLHWFAYLRFSCLRALSISLALSFLVVWESICSVSHSSLRPMSTVLLLPACCGRFFFNLFILLHSSVININICRSHLISNFMLPTVNVIGIMKCGMNEMRVARFHFHLFHFLRYNIYWNVFVVVA